MGSMVKVPSPTLSPLNRQTTSTLITLIGTYTLRPHHGRQHITDGQGRFEIGEEIGVLQHV
jgi:hypothetical protein